MRTVLDFHTSSTSVVFPPARRSQGGISPTVQAKEKIGGAGCIRDPGDSGGHVRGA